MQQDDELRQLDLKLFRVWGKATKSIFDNVRKDIACHGIDPDQFIILELLYSKGPHPIQRISEIFSIPSGSITYVIDKLEKKEFVRREPCPTDRRASFVVLTESGKALLDDVFPKHAQVIADNLAPLTKEEKLLLAELFKKVGLAAETLKQSHGNTE